MTFPIDRPTIYARVPLQTVRSNDDLYYVDKGQLRLSSSLVNRCNDLYEQQLTDDLFVADNDPLMSDISILYQTDWSTDSIG